MADRIQFDSVKRLWWTLAKFLDPPYTTEFNNWEAVAEHLEFKPIDVNQIKALKDETGSNTMIMFKHYVQKTNGGDLREVIQILQNLNRRDALDYLTRNVDEIKRNNTHLCGPSTTQQCGEPMDDRDTSECLHIQDQTRQHELMQSQYLQQHKFQQQHAQYAKMQGEHPIQYQHPSEDPMHQEPHQQHTRLHMPPEHMPEQRQPLSQMKEPHQQPRSQLPRQLPRGHYQTQYGVEPAGPYSPQNLPQPPKSDRLYLASGSDRATHVSTSKRQLVYQPTAKQRDSIEQQQWSKCGASFHPGMMVPQHQQHNRAIPQDKPMNLKKSSVSQPPLPQQQRMPYNNFNKRTPDDFFPGFGQQYVIQIPGESNPSMNVQCQDRHISSMNPSLTYHNAPMATEFPADFTEVLLRGERKLDSLSQMPLVITPLELAHEPQQPMTDATNFQPMEVTEGTMLHRSEVQFAKLPPDVQMMQDTSVVPESFDNTNSIVPLTISPIKQEQPDDTSPMLKASPKATMDYFMQDPAEPFQQVPVRESVIQMGPQCNSDSAASPGDLLGYSEMVQERDEDGTEGRVNSYPAYPVQRPHATEIRNRCNLVRLTWPLSAQDLKQRRTPVIPKQTKLIIKSHVSSTDKDFKPNDQKKQPIKVLLTHTLNGKDAKLHKKELTVLYNCLKKNGFLPSLDFMEFREFSQDIHHWMDIRFKEAQFVLVCITPQYNIDVDPSLPVQQNIYTRSCRYIHKLMQGEFSKQHCQNTRFRPVLFPGAEQKHIPMWMQSTVAFRWRENWKDIMYMMLEPERILAKIKNNQEKFTKSQPVIKIVQRSM